MNGLSHFDCADYKNVVSLKYKIKNRRLINLGCHQTNILRLFPIKMSAKLIIMFNSKNIFIQNTSIFHQEIKSFSPHKIALDRLVRNFIC